MNKNEKLAIGSKHGNMFKNYVHFRLIHEIRKRPPCISRNLEAHDHLFPHQGTFNPKS